MLLYSRGNFYTWMWILHTAQKVRNKLLLSLPSWCNKSRVLKNYLISTRISTSKNLLIYIILPAIVQLTSTSKKLKNCFCSTDSQIDQFKLKPGKHIGSSSSSIFTRENTLTRSLLGVSIYCPHLFIVWLKLTSASCSNGALSLSERTTSTHSCGTQLWLIIYPWLENSLFPHFLVKLFPENSASRLIM